MAYHGIRHALHRFGFMMYRVHIHDGRGELGATIIEKPGKRHLTLYDDDLASAAVLVAGAFAFAYMVYQYFW